MNKTIDISIVIPCFNETESIDYLVSKLKELEEELTDPHEFIFIDDGSLDSTYEKLTNFYRERIGKDVKVVRHAENRGVGGAIKTGISNSCGEYIAVIDSDCTYEPTYLLKMFDIVRKTNADIITTSPYHPEGSTLHAPHYRLFLSKGLSTIYNIISKSKFYTYTSMFRIYRRGAIRDVDFRSDGFLAMAEILIKARQLGFKIIEYPAVLKGRRFGVSNAKILKLIREHLGFIIKILQKKERI